MNPNYLDYPLSGGFNVPKAQNIRRNFTGYNRDNFRKADNVKQRFSRGVSTRLPKGVGAGRKKKLFKEIGEVLGSVSSIKNLLGSIDGSANHIQKLLTKERQKFLNNIKKSGTQVKKLIEQKGGATKQALDEKKKHMEKEKENMKKILLKAQLHALKEINGRI